MYLFFYIQLNDIKIDVKRNIEYKSCKLPSVCQNKTECIWDLRLLMVISYLFSQRHKDIDLETFVLTIVNMVNISIILSEISLPSPPLTPPSFSLHIYITLASPRDFAAQFLFLFLSNVCLSDCALCVTNMTYVKNKTIVLNFFLKI